MNWSIAGALLLVLLFKGSSDFSEEETSKKYPLYKKYLKEVGRFLPLKKKFKIENNYSENQNESSEHSGVGNENIKKNQRNMNRIGIDMINLSNEESFDITINKYLV